jgi:hypothetical protein
VGPFMGLFYAWGEWQGAVYEVQFPSWRRTVIVVGLVSVTLQALSFLALWTPFSRHDAFVRRALPIELLLVAPTVLSIFIWKHKARWWLLASSLFLCVDSFFVALAELAY